MSSRGRYERGLSPAERWGRHRSELIRSAARLTHAAPGTSPSVSDIARGANKGRNTFYAHFGSTEQALRAAEAAAVHAVSTRVEAALARAATPREKLRAITEAWLDAAELEPDLVLALLVASRRSELSREQLRRVLIEAKQAGIVSEPIERERLEATAGALEALVRSYATGVSRREDVERRAVDVVLRIFR